MPDIGLFELILVGAVAFLVLGPERMPEFLAQIGRAVRSARSWGNDIRRQINEETKDLKAPVSDVKDALSPGLSSLNDGDDKTIRPKAPEEKP